MKSTAKKRKIENGVRKENTVIFILLTLFTQTIKNIFCKKNRDAQQNFNFLYHTAVVFFTNPLILRGFPISCSGE